MICLKANDIKKRDRWECGDYVIFIDDDEFYVVAQINRDGRGGWHFGMNSDHDLWFKTYKSARKHLKENSLVEGRFIKIKGWNRHY
jgi:hypothetical protein